MSVPCCRHVLHGNRTAAQGCPEAGITCRLKDITACAPDAQLHAPHTNLGCCREQLPAAASRQCSKDHVCFSRRQYLCHVHKNQNPHIQYCGAGAPTRNLAQGPYSTGCWWTKLPHSSTGTHPCAACHTHRRPAHAAFFSSCCVCCKLENPQLLLLPFVQSSGSCRLAAFLQIDMTVLLSKQLLMPRLPDIYAEQAEKAGQLTSDVPKLGEFGSCRRRTAVSSV